MKFAYKILAAAAAITLASAASAGVVIDNFDVDQDAIFDQSTNSMGKADEISGPSASILGGYRDIYINNVSGIGPLNASTIAVGGSNLAVATGPGSVGVGIVRWDGDTVLAGNSMDTLNTAAAIASIDQTGFAGQDLTTNASVGISVATASDLTYSIEFQVFSGAGNWSKLIKSGSGASSFSFDDFISQGGTGADFTNVTAMQMIINFTSGVKALDLEVDIIQAVPEPGTIALAGLALLGLGVARRRSA